MLLRNGTGDQDGIIALAGYVHNDDNSSAYAQQFFAGLLDRVGLGGPPRIDDEPLTDPPLHALSLAIAQKCNLGCTYCYAQQGEFGGAAKNMTRETADQAVDLTDFNPA